MIWIALAAAFGSGVTTTLALGAADEFVETNDLTARRHARKFIITAAAFGLASGVAVALS